jgi:hypothetical protein
VNEDIDSQSFWNSFVRNIAAETGLPVMQQYETRDKAVAELVLPRMVEILPALKDENLRSAVYHHFLTPHAYRYIEQVIQWWSIETDYLGVDCLSQALRVLTKGRDANQVWALCRNREPFPYALAARLASFPEVGQEIKDFIVQKLCAGNIRVTELPFVCDIDDPRVVEWFRGQLNSPIRDVRETAKRAVRRGERLPSGVQFEEPDRSKAIFSAEVDLEELAFTLKEVGKTFEFDLPKALKRPAFLSGVVVDRWLSTAAKTNDDRSIRIFLRLEDVDAVEIVVTASL